MNQQQLVEMLSRPQTISATWGLEGSLVSQYGGNQFEWKNTTGFTVTEGSRVRFQIPATAAPLKIGDGVDLTERLHISGVGDILTSVTDVKIDGTNEGLYLLYDSTNHAAAIRSVWWWNSYEPLYFQAKEFAWATGTTSLTARAWLTATKFKVAGDVEIGDANAFYLGDPDTNDSWRIVRSGNDLLIQRRITGTWTTKSTITG